MGGGAQIRACELEFGLLAGVEEICQFQAALGQLEIEERFAV